MKDYYKILGVHRHASESEIKRAFRRLAVQYHPDRNPEPAAEQLFKEINEAYNVLSDPQKKQTYDSHLERPFAEITQEGPPQPYRRDPRYRGRGGRAAGSAVNKTNEQYELMRRYLSYVRLACWAGLVITILFGVDYFLPYNIVEEPIEGIYVMKSSRGAYVYHLVVTASGMEIKMYNHEAGYFFNESAIKVSYTTIYSTPLWVSNASGTHVVKLGSMYHSMLFMPMVLFAVSVLGIIFRHKVEFCFNLSIVSAILSIINLFLLL